LRERTNVLVLSKKEDLAKLFIEESVAPHIRSIQALVQYEQGYIPSTSIYKHSARFANGSCITALSSSPDSARSTEGHVLLDEYSFHLEARRVYEAITPSITRGYDLEIISTPNGQQGEFYNLAKASGLVDGRRSADCQFSAHKTDIHQAIAQGCKDRFGKLLRTEELRADCLDEEMWLQEYCCQFLSIASQWIPPELFEANTSREVTEALEKLAGRPPEGARDLYAGWDIARNKDLSVIWLTEVVGDVSWCRGIIELSGMATPTQVREAQSMMPMIRRMSIDKSGMGLAIFEALQEKYGSGRIEGLQFTLPVKEALAVHAKRRMEEHKCRIPDFDIVRNSFRMVKKTVTATGQARFDAEHDAQWGHSDHFWSMCLAEDAASQPTFGLLEYFKTGAAQHDLDEMTKEKVVEASTLAKPMIADQATGCSSCGSKLIRPIPGGQHRCSQCSLQFFLSGKAPDVYRGPSRSELIQK
jgi:phage FluMu gp28-like protein